MKIDVQLRPHVFSGSDSIAILSFLAKFKDPCSPNRIAESIAVWCLQFYMEVQAEMHMLCRRTGSSVAVDYRRSRMLRTHRDVVNFLLRTYAPDEVIAEAFSDVFNFCKSSAMTEET